MIDEKLIKEKLFYLSDNYCVPISIRDKGDKIYIDIKDCNYKFTIVKNAQMEYGLLDVDKLEVLNEWFSSIDNLIECLMNSCSSDKFKTKYK